jgi:hypothetical protein
VNDISARLPEDVTGLEDALGFAFELEPHLPLDHIAESRPAGVAVGRRTGVSRRILDDDRHRVPTGGNDRWFYLLQNGQCCLSSARARLTSGGVRFAFGHRNLQIGGLEFVDHP